MSRQRIYLAGPDVFLPNPLEVGKRKKAVCEKYGLEGIFPMDSVDLPTDLDLPAQGRFISRLMEKIMTECDAIIANITPFHGPSVDAGTAYEMGFMRALGKPVSAYSNDNRRFAERVTDFWKGDVRMRDDGELEGPDGMMLESFDLNDNLMIAGGITAAGGILVAGDVDPEDYYTSLENYEVCVARTAELLLK